MVVAGHPAAAEAGVAVLRSGGNAVDAAVATALTLGVAEPWGSGLGGKLILLYFEAESGRVFCLQAMDQASVDADPAALAKVSSSERKEGPKAVAVPGMLAGWGMAHQRWGSQPWDQLVQPAIDAAESGVVLDRFDVAAANNAREKLDAGGALGLFFPQGQTLSTGDVIRYPELAATLKLIRDDGPGVMYGGPLGERIARSIQDQGGTMNARDFTSYRPEIKPAPSAEYRGRQVYSSIPPATGGVTVLLTLAALDASPADAPPDEAASPAQRTDQLLRLLHEVYPAMRTVGDGRDGLRQMDLLLRPRAVAEVARAARDLAFQTKQPVSSAGGPAVDLAAAAIPKPDESLRLACTSHFLVADAAGNMVSATQSLGYHFGAGVVIPGTGIVMNNSIDNFAVKSPNSSNYLVPGKRARSTMAPLLMIEHGRAVLGAGAPGGQRIPTAVLQVVTGIIDGGMSPAQAVDAPRLHLRHVSGDGPERRVVDSEADLDQPLPASLTDAGWRLRSTDDQSMMYFGGVNLIVAQPDGGWQGIADDRRTNAARAQ